MSNRKIENLLVKFLCNQANSEELDVLHDWIQDPKNESLLKSYVKVKLAVDYNLIDFNKENSKKQLLDLIQKEQRVRKLKIVRNWSYAAAASIILFISITYVVKNHFNSQLEVSPAVVEQNNSIQSGTDKATLTLEDGSEVALEKGTQYQNQNVSSNGQEIVYNTASASKEIAYNYLTIPRGGQFYVTLSDGTQVWLNSDSKLKYPVSFVEGESRQVELVYGEAYFEVSHSTEHQGANFKVFHSGQEIEVLGTEFNVKAYKEESNVFTTLVTGKVEVSYNNTSENLSPGQQLDLNLNTGSFTIAQVDTNAVSAWKRGLFMFKSESLQDIAKVLERWYDVDMNIAEDLKSIEFKGTLSKNQNLEEILTLFKNTNFIKEFTINNKSITIN